MKTLNSRLPWIWAGLVTVASVVLFLVASSGIEGFEYGAAETASWMVLPILYTWLGALIVARQPGNRIAWILFSVAVGVLLDGAAQPFILTAPNPPTAIDYLALFLANSMWVVIFFPLFMLLYLFPTGRFLSRRWAWAGWLAVGMVVTFLVIGIFAETWGTPNDDWVIDNPIGFVPNDWGAFGVVWNLGLIALPVGGFAAMTVRFRRSNVVERTQIKWVLYAALVFALSYVGSVILNAVGGSFGDLLIGSLFALSLALLPLSIAAAITRYRLFEIDRIISRTLAYAVVVALLGALYFGMITLITSLLPTQNALAVAGSTLAVAALFNPVRKRIQHAVDRRFNRSGYQAEVVSEEFASTMRGSLTAEELVDEWNRTVTDTFHPEAIGIWLNQNYQETRSQPRRRAGRVRQ
ncbi:MAG: hypothetical protein U9N56_02050 [Actinomycetota bacterium]|nr:hypothetical protein [Actinomycetota bacterium]